MNTCMAFTPPKDKKYLLKKSTQISIDDCFKKFQEPEVLGKQNTWYCPQCKDHKQANKMMSIFKVPQYLVIHLKRFRTG